jgi:hypothetical protein
MGRKAESKCLYCSRNYTTEEEAKTKHPDCYISKNRLCYHKRYRLKNASKVNALRRDNNAKKRGITTIEPLLPEAYRAELAIYGRENQFVHSVALNIFQGSKLSHQMHPQHTQGLRQPELEDYIQKLIAHLETEFGIDCFGLVYWLNPDDCPICR